MTNDDRITALAQSIYIARHNQKNDVTGSDLVDFQDQTIEWVNQFIPELEMAKTPSGEPVYWNFVRTNNATIGTVTAGTTISYMLPSTVRRIVVSPYRDLTIQQDGSVISTFRMVSPDQQGVPLDYDTRSRATVLGRNLIFSRSLLDTEVGGDIVADVVAPIPELSHTDVALLDILDQYSEIKQLFILGVLKNQILPDIVQGGLTPSYSQRYTAHLTNCIADNILSSEADDVDRESFGWVGGVGF